MSRIERSFFRAARSPSRPLIFAHRGSSARITENTLQAFEAAKREGSDGVEFDVRLCASGDIVVFHDHSLARMAGRPEKIESTPLSTLRHLQLSDGSTIPTLPEVFDLLGPDMLIDVEIKSGPSNRRQVVAKTLEEITRFQAEERVVVSSFDPRVIVEVRIQNSRIATGLLFHRYQLKPLRDAWLARVLGVHCLHPDNGLTSAKQLKKWKSQGYFIHVWTIDSASELRRLNQHRVDAICTNDPLRALKVFEENEHEFSR